MAGRYFGIPFATSGDKIVVPDATQPDGSVSFTQGFGFDYERANTDPDYKPVPRDGTNGLFHDITEATGIMQKQGVADWTVDAQPYQINALVRHNDVVWRSLVATNNVEPVEGASWTSIENSGSAIIGSSRNLVGAYATAATATYTADELVMKNSAGAAYVATGVSFTVDIETSGVNGRDDFTEAPSTFYYVHAIYNGTNTNGLISTSATAPTLPSGYTYSALIGVIRNDSSSDFISFLQNDRKISISPQNVFTGVTGVSSFTSVSVSSHVPPIAKSCDGWFGHASTNVTSGVRVATDSNGLGAQAMAAQSSGIVYDGYAMRMTFIDLKCPSQTIYWASVNAGTATHAMAIVGYQI